MRTVIKNNIYVYDANAELITWAEEHLVLTNPVYATMMRLGKQDTINRKHIPETIKLYSSIYGTGGLSLVLPFGVLYAIWPMIKNSPYELKLNDNGYVIDRNLKIADPLFDYQEDAVTTLLNAKGGVLKASAGSGKTNCGIDLIRRIGRNALWLCGKTDLLNQTVSRIHKLYPSIHVGTITDGDVKMVTDGITVSTVQTLVNVDKDIYKDKFDVVIVDECHACVSDPINLKMFGKVVESIGARYKYGLTATPSRSDTLINSMYAILGCNMKGQFAPTFSIDKEKTNTLTAKHIKVDLATPFEWACLNEDGTFNYVELIEFLGANKTRNETIVNNVVAQREKHPKQLVLCYRIEQCETINEMLVERGMKSVLLVGSVTKKKRKEILEGITDWEVIVGTISLVKEGLDVPELSCLHWAMVIGDKVATVQSAGRIERVCEGKPDPEIYDYVDMNYPYCIGKWKKRVTFLKNR